MNRRELEQLYQRYAYLVHRRCRSLTGNDADAEDALQEVFARVQRYDRGQQKDSELAWLYAVASNVCFDLLKKSGRAAPTSPEALVQLDGRAQGDAATADRRALVGVVLRKLDTTAQQIGVLHHLDGYTQEEVAQRTGYSRKTVGKKLQLFEAAFQALWRSAHDMRSPS